MHRWCSIVYFMIAASAFGFVPEPTWHVNFRTNAGTAEAFLVDGKNQLTNSPHGAGTYDANGNLTASHDGVWDLTEYTYDDENQLIRTTFWGEPEGGGDSMPLRYTDFFYDGHRRLRVRVEYAWDAMGNDWTSEAVTRYLYDGRRVIQERDGDNTPTVSYTRGSDLGGGHVRTLCVERLSKTSSPGGLLRRSQPPHPRELSALDYG